MARICNTCGEEKPLSEYSKVPKCVGGLNPKCRQCMRLRQLELMPLEKQAALAERPRIKARELLKAGFKKCPLCREVKPLTEYHRGSATRWGKHGIASRCKGCASVLNQEYRRDHRDRLEEYNKKYRERDEIASRRTVLRKARVARTPRHIMQITLRHGLNRKPTEFPATVDDLVEMFKQQQGRCAISGVMLTWAQGKILPTSISLDRINPEGGYSKDNLRLVCQAVNAFKGRMSDDEMYLMALAIVSNMKRPKLRLVG